MSEFLCTDSIHLCLGSVWKKEWNILQIQLKIFASKWHWRVIAHGAKSIFCCLHLISSGFELNQCPVTLLFTQAHCILPLTIVLRMNYIEDRYKKKTGSQTEGKKKQQQQTGKKKTNRETNKKISIWKIEIFDIEFFFF